MPSTSLVHTSLSLKMIYAQSFGLFSGFLLLSLPISELSATMRFLLSGLSIGVGHSCYVAVCHPQKGQTRP
ncbi:hypothetical protein RO3G_01907 [Rhizopus delemar RA 99-880]|uniref:Uncharacterized protein n=1 Tax=Rhizopus delemar (strain RA 99-880 / ATCC MYA-4621 / FGSC 9543 / NRRL 43880) TaxID=246409 RepID=I1BLX3_RHIO9|nr:hypothetical protein RO3G_01907 [Rhizopus delemar RA 99-880]|eukprot:EIE77203.1 hypothetical protein RO3G_01907 [Rhizopus delemar RA 99-880]